MPALVHIAKMCNAAAVKALALDVLATITTENQASQEAIRRTNMALNDILKCFDSNDVEVKEQSVRALGALASGGNLEFQRLICQVPDRVPERLMTLVDLDGEENLQAAAALTLAYLAENNLDASTKILKWGAARRMVQFLVSNSERMQRDGANALRVLARGVTTRASVSQALADGIAVGHLCQLARFSTSDAVRAESMGALFEMADAKASIAKITFTSLGPDIIVDGMSSPNKDLQYWAAGLAWQCGKNSETTRRELIAANVNSPLQKNLLTSTAWNVREGAEFIATALNRTTGPAPLPGTAKV